MHTQNYHLLKTGYIEFARLESSARGSPVAAQCLSSSNSDMSLVLPAIVLRHADNLPAIGLPQAVADSEPQLPWQPPG